MIRKDFENKKSNLYKDLKKLNEIVTFMVEIGYSHKQINTKIKEVKKYISETYNVNLMLEDRYEDKNSKN